MIFCRQQTSGRLGAALRVRFRTALWSAKPAAVTVGCLLATLIASGSLADSATVESALEAEPVSALFDYPSVAPGVSFDAVQALPARAADHVFQYGPAVQQFAELWLPASQQPAPVMVFVHGGCWLNAYGLDYSRAMATALAAKGYAVWSIEYRRLGDPGGGWPGSQDDIVSAITALRMQHARRTDWTNWVLSGHSAGGHLSLLAVPFLDNASAPTAVLALAPIVNLETYARGEEGCNQAGAEFLATVPDPALANPRRRAAPAGTVVLLGRDDRIIPFRQIDDWPQRLVTADAGHFDWVHPGTPAWRRFLKELAAVSDSVGAAHHDQ